MEEDDDGSRVSPQLQHSDNLPLNNQQQQQLSFEIDVSNKEESQESSFFDIQLPEIDNQVDIFNDVEKLHEEPSLTAQSEFDNSIKLLEDSLSYHTDAVVEEQPSIPSTEVVAPILPQQTLSTDIPDVASNDSHAEEDPPCNAPSMASEQEPSIVAQDLPSTVIEDAHAPSLQFEGEGEGEGATLNEPSVVSEEVPSVVAAELPLVADENTHEAPSKIAEEIPMGVYEEAAMSPINLPQDKPSSTNEDIDAQAASSVSADGLPITGSSIAEVALDGAAEDPLNGVAEEARAGVAEESRAGIAEDTKDTVSMVTEDAPPILAEKIPSSKDEESLSLTAEGATEMIVEAEETLVKVSETVSPMVVDNASSISEKDDLPVVKEDASLRVSEDSPPIDDENASAVGADEAAHVSDADTEMEVETEVETEVVETGSSGGRKRKRGRPKVQAKAPVSRRTEEEDVCFICFDGGNLVLCDRRGCPKAYHPSCVNRDEAFFRSKGRWNCGWHICSNCEKSAQYMCYTCTYSLCKGCVKESEFLCVRGNRGFCEACMRTVMLIEKNEQAQVDFDDKSSWEYLFKEYWTELKRKVSLTLDELTQAKNPFKGSNTSTRKGESSEELYDANDTKDSDSEDSSGLLEMSSSKRRKPKRKSKSSKDEPPSVTTADSGVTDAVGEKQSLSTNTEWASKDLLELVAHMKNGDKSVLSQYDVQALLLDYIKLNKLRDPQRKSQIVCDSRLMNLFGKARVGHFEMLKLLESHFLIKEDVHADDVNGATTDTEANKMDGDGSAGASTKASSDKRRKSRKKGDGRGPQTNLDDYAAVDVHNIKLLYLRRNLMEDLLEDGDKFHENVVGSFVRIRISGAGQKQDMYRLVQVVGTRKAAEPYKTGKRLADVVLEILNLNKSEVISIDTISNQDFSEDECKRLRQSIKCGLISRMTVGEVQEKALALQAVRVNDWLEMEKMRISHLRDRASEQGRRKDLRECVEKLQLLNTPEERSRRLQEIPEVHADPNMDPNHESEEDEEQDDRPQDKVMMARETGFSRKGREPISPGKGNPASVDTWTGARRSVTTGPEPVRNMSTSGVWDTGYGANGVGESVSNDARHLNSGEISKNLASATGLVTGASSGQAGGRSGPSGNLQDPAAPLSTTTISSNISETEKMWHYQDPSGKIQGPFSMVQLRKWSTTGHFPVDLRIWRTTEKQEDSILLTDALVGKFNKELPPKGNSFSPPEKMVALSGNNLREVNLGSGWEASTNTSWTDKSRTERTVTSNWKDASGWEGSTNTPWTDKSQIGRVSNSNWKDGSVWDGSTDAVRTDKNHIDRTMNSNWKDASGFANGSTQLANSDAWGSGSSSWPAQTTDPKLEHSGYSSRGSWNSRGGNTWPGRTVHSPHSTSSYSGQHHHRPTSHQGGQSGGRWSHGPNRGNNWNSGRYRGAHSDSGRGYDKRANNMGHLGQSSGDNWRAPPETSSKGWGSWNTVETPKPVTDGWDFNAGNRNNSSNLPSPTPTTGRGNPTEQASGNRWSPTPVSSFPANTLPSTVTAPRMGSNGAQLSPIRMVELNKSGSGWNEEQQFGGTPSGGLGLAFVPNKPAEILNQDGRGNYPSPTPTPHP